MIHNTTSATFTSYTHAFPSARHATDRALAWAAWPKAQHGSAAEAWAAKRWR